MIGSFPIGVVSIGSNYQPGPLTEALGVAGATADALLLGLITNPTLGIASSSSSGTDIVTLSRVQAGSSNASSNAIGVLLNIGTFLERAEAVASANSISGLSISLSPIDATASSLNGQMLSKINLGIGSSSISGISVIPKHIANMIFAHAIASGESIGNLQIRLKIGRVDSNVSGLDITTLSKLTMGISSSEINSLDASTRSFLDTIIADSNANALDLDKLLISLESNSASATALSLNAATKIYTQIGQAICSAAGVDFSGLRIGLFPAEALSNAKTLGMGIPLVTAGLSSQSLGSIPLVKPDLILASSAVQAYAFEPMILNIIIGEMIASAKDADITFLINGVPDIIATRSEDFTEVVLKVLNDTIGNVNIYRADDHRGLFELLAQNQTSPYTDSGLDETLNYKYKAAFIITGTKGGETVVVEGEKSLPRYTIGNKTL